MMEPPAALALAQIGIPYAIFRHEQPVHSLEEAAAQRGQQPGQVVRSILFRLGAGQFIMVLMAGPAQIAWPTLRSYLGQSRISMASEEEVLTVTGYRVGAVSPFGIAQPLRILADESVFAAQEISLGSGERSVAILMRSADLQKALPGLEIGQFAEAK